MNILNFEPLLESAAGVESIIHLPFTSSSNRRDCKSDSKYSTENRR